MKRKVIQIAESTQLISLPRKWCQRFDVKKGDELELTEQGNQVIVSTQKGTKVASLDWDISKLNPMLLRLIGTAYKKGIDEISIHYATPDQLSLIQKILSESFIGFEIISQAKDRCVIKSIGGAYEAEFDTMLRRVFLLQKSMIDGIIDAMEQGKVENVENVRHLEVLNNKSTGFCRRVLNKQGYKDFNNITFMYCIVEELEKIADQFKYICDYFLEHHSEIKKLNKEVIDSFKAVGHLFDSSYELFYKFDLNKAVELYKVRKELISKAESLFRGKSKTDDMMAHYLLTIVQQISNNVTFMAAMSM